MDVPSDERNQASAPYDEDTSPEGSAVPPIGGYSYPPPGSDPSGFGYPSPPPPGEATWGAPILLTLLLLLVLGTAIIFTWIALRG